MNVEAISCPNRDVSFGVFAYPESRRLAYPESRRLAYPESRRLAYLRFYWNHPQGHCHTNP